MSTGPHSPQAAEAAVQATVLDDTSAIVTRNYAEALLNASSKDGQVEPVLGELEELVGDLVERDGRFLSLMTSPSISAADRDRVLVEMFEGRAQPTVVRFLRVMNRHGRLSMLGPTVRQARILWDRRQNRKRVTVRSAATLDDGQRSAIADRLGRMLAATPVVSYEVDPSLIGGLVVQVGDDVYDASIRTQLEKMRRRLVEDRIGELRARMASFTA